MTLEENNDLSQFIIDELQASLINHENRINISNTSLKCAFAAQSSISRVRGRGRYNSRCRVIRCSRGLRSSSLANVTGRGKNQNPNHPSGQVFDK